MSTVKGLLDAKFISEAKYREFLSNFVLVKKASGKWIMCIDYTHLNRACPKDSYPLVNINKLSRACTRFYPSYTLTLGTTYKFIVQPKRGDELGFLVFYQF